MEDIEELQGNRQELAWLYRAMDIIRAHQERQWQKYVDETEAAGGEVDYGKLHEYTNKIVEFDTKVREGFIWFADLAQVNDHTLLHCRKVAVLIELGALMAEIQPDVVAALVEIDEWLGRLRAKMSQTTKAIEQSFPDVRADFDAKREAQLKQAVELKRIHGDAKSIDECLIAAGIDMPDGADKAAFQRTKKELGIEIPKGKTGPKPKRLKKSN